jgi:hypothetical protein
MPYRAESHRAEVCEKWGVVLLFWRDRLDFTYRRLAERGALVSQADAARILGVSLMTVNNHVRGGTWRSVRLRGHRVLRLADVLKRRGR